MVQAAAKAQAVVIETKNHTGGVLPTSSAEIAALSRIQAQVIVNAHSQTVMIGTTCSSPIEGGSGKSTNQQLQNQINIQAQALVYAYTQEVARMIPLPIGDPKKSDFEEIASGLAGDKFPDGWSMKTYRSVKGESVRRITRFWFSRKSCFHLFAHCLSTTNLV
jgi:hypothetical protein